MAEDYIVFTDAGSSPSGKTKRWTVASKLASDFNLGTVRWYAPWRKYVFEAGRALFDEGCMQEIVNFLRIETEKHYAALDSR